MERFSYQHSAEDARADNERFFSQFSRLINNHSYLLDHIDTQSNENLYLCNQNDFLCSQVSDLSGLLYNSDLRNWILSDENRTLTEERRCFSNEKAMFTRHYPALQNSFTNQGGSICTLRNQYDDDVKRLTLENEKIIRRKINMNKLREQHKRIKGSYDILVKENSSSRFNWWWLW